MLQGGQPALDARLVYASNLGICLHEEGPVRAGGGRRSGARAFSGWQDPSSAATRREYFPTRLKVFLSEPDTHSWGGKAGARKLSPQPYCLSSP
jgi:hypothetical protein